MRERERPDETLRVRIGLNVGEVLEREGTPFGAAVNAGARVMAKADGGEILVSETVRQLAGTLPGIQYRDRGSRCRSKDSTSRAPLRGRVARSAAEAS